MSTINMESTLLKPPVVSKIGLNCFELIFFNKLGWLWGYFTFFGLGRKVRFNFDMNYWEVQEAV